MRYFLPLLIVLTFGTPALASSPFDTSSEPFAADVYPSRKTAIDRLVAQIIRELRENPNFSATGTTIQFSRNGISPEELAASVIAPVHQAFANAKIERTEEPRPDEHTLAIGSVISDARLTISFGGSKLSTQTISARCVEKPWADDWAMYVNTNPGKRWVRGTSASPCASDDEAIAAARKAAVAEMADLVLTEMRARNVRSTGPKIPVSREWIASRVAESLKRNLNGLLVRDTFMQRFSRPYGDVWQASILVDASPKIIGQLVDSYDRAANAQFGTRAMGFGAIAAMGALIVLLYAFVNAVTKGYFMWRLRAVALLAAIAGVMLVFALT